MVHLITVNCTHFACFRGFLPTTARLVTPGSGHTHTLTRVPSTHPGSAGSGKDNRQTKRWMMGRWGLLGCLFGCLLATPARIFYPVFTIERIGDAEKTV